MFRRLERVLLLETRTSNLMNYRPVVTYRRYTHHVNRSVPSRLDQETHLNNLFIGQQVHTSPINFSTNNPVNMVKELKKEVQKASERLSDQRSKGIAHLYFDIFSLVEKYVAALLDQIELLRRREKENAVKVQQQLDIKIYSSRRKLKSLDKSLTGLYNKMEKIQVETKRLLKQNPNFRDENIKAFSNLARKNIIQIRKMTDKLETEIDKIQERIDKKTIKSKKK